MRTIQFILVLLLAPSLPTPGTTLSAGEVFGSVKGMRRTLKDLHALAPRRASPGRPLRLR
jgi:hypothetical protein